MLHDHMMYFGDKELLLDNLPTVEGILNFFHKHTEKEGYVGILGGLNGKARYWSFIDWTPEWNATTGVPAAIKKGPITMESLLYIMGLQQGAEVAEYLDHKEQAELYRREAKRIQESIRKYCAGANGLLQDGPGVEEYSQQVQVFAALTDTIEENKARENLKETILHKKKYTQCSVAMAFYLFRALEKTGLYAYTESYWEIWTEMLERGSTTCVEDAVLERSDCHAWGSLILYELPSVILGVQPGTPGYETVRINPVPGYLTAASGNVVTPRGTVSVKWEKEGNNINLQYDAPEQMKIEVS